MLSPITPWPLNARKSRYIKATTRRLQLKKRQDQTEIAQNTHLKTEISRLKQTAYDKKLWAENKERSIYGDRHVKNSGHRGRGFISARAARTMKKSKNLEHRMNKEIE